MELLVGKEEALRILEERINIGCTLRELNDIPKVSVSDWCRYTAVELDRLFKYGDIHRRYLLKCPDWAFDTPPETDLSRDIVRKQVHTVVRALETWREDLIGKDITPKSRKVFVVHGHDQAAQDAVESFLRRLELHPIFLQDVADRGRTIIEKFEQNSNADFAVVILTPDDIGHLATEPEEARSRARQNVIFELGFFMAKLGRARVCALLSGDVERPSDFDGVIYVRMDAGEWKVKLAQNMIDADMDIDARRIVQGYLD